MTEPTASNLLPLVTVIMPIRNEARFIARSLGAVLVQDYPAECLEVLVVDGSSTDATRTIVTGLQATHPYLRLLDNPPGIVSSGLNRGLAVARGRIIVRVDGHTEIAPDYVRQCVTELRRTGADNVGGKMAAQGLGTFGAAVALATSSPFGVGNARFHYSNDEEFVDTVYMGAWPREVFRRIGLFDEELVRNQDDEFNYRLLDHGGRILLSPRIRSFYINRGSPRTLALQYFQYGYWKVRVMQKHPRQMRLRQFAPPALVAALLGGALLAPWQRVLRRAWAALILFYLLATLGAAGWVAYRAGARAAFHVLPVLPAVFVTLHLSYGLGFLVGLVRFARHWWGSR